MPEEMAAALSELRGTGETVQDFALLLEVAEWLYKACRVASVRAAVWELKAHFLRPPNPLPTPKHSSNELPLHGLRAPVRWPPQPLPLAGECLRVKVRNPSCPAPLH